jgi:hypothetical protein
MLLRASVYACACILYMYIQVHPYELVCMCVLYQCVCEGMFTCGCATVHTYVCVRACVGVRAYVCVRAWEAVQVVVHAHFGSLMMHIIYPTYLLYK